MLFRSGRPSEPDAGLPVQGGVRPDVRGVGAGDAAHADPLHVRNHLPAKAYPLPSK